LADVVRDIPALVTLLNDPASSRRASAPKWVRR
jgi:hypothetical protein